MKPARIRQRRVVGFDAARHPLTAQERVGRWKHRTKGAKPQLRRRRPIRHEATIPTPKIAKLPGSGITCERTKV